MIRSLALGFLLLATSSQSALVEEVDPFIGTAGPGNTFPGAVLPWGMVSVSPHNELSKPSAYKKGNKVLRGFGHVHLSGVGCPDLGNIVLMPGRVGNDLTQGSPMGEEFASPGYYRVRLPGEKILAEMTVTPRSGMSRYRFERVSASPQVALDLSQALKTVSARDLQIHPDGSAQGFSQSGGFCGNASQRKVYFYAVFSPRPKQVRAWPNKQGATFSWEPGLSQVLVKVGVSYVSADNARQNMEGEDPNWDFEATRAAAAAAWEAELSHVAIQGGGAEARRVFYTALYHALLHPSLFSDLNGQYQGLENSGVKTLSKAQGAQYSVFSLWDTYRTLHPLLILLWPSRQLDMVRSMARMAHDSGWLPKWELAGNETYTMVGDPALPVLADSYLAGLTDFDVEAAWQAAWRSATTPGSKMRPGLKAIEKYGYIAENDTQGDFVWGSVSSTLEYAYADWSLAAWAMKLGKNKEAQWLLEKRAPMWKAFYDQETGLLRPRLANGHFLSSFGPLLQCCDKSGWPDNGGPGYVEGNAWQYTWFVPHAMPELIQAMGSARAFERKLQACFDQGQFAMWNEPDMAYPWLFDYVPGQEWKTVKLVRETALKHFNTSASGIPGNDDCGTTSAWQVFATLGFYPDCPASGRYALAAPLFPEIRLDLENGKQIRLSNRRLGQDQGAHAWNGALLKTHFVSRDVLTQGGSLTFE